MADEGGGGERSINLATLSLEQLNQLKNQYQEDVQGLTANYASLRDALARFQESKSAVAALGGDAGNGRDILVPLTQSLYVPGKIVDGNKLLVDVGTGYYAEKDQQQTEDFLQRKGDMIEVNLASLREHIDMKRREYEMIAQAMQQRLMQIEEKRSELMASQG
jgi:prefoldin alpha subunit